MGFSRQEHWSGLLCPSPGDLPDPGIEPVVLISHIWFEINLNCILIRMLCSLSFSWQMPPPSTQSKVATQSLTTYPSTLTTCLALTFIYFVYLFSCLLLDHELHVSLFVYYGFHWLAQSRCLIKVLNEE